MVHGTSFFCYMGVHPMCENTYQADNTDLRYRLG